VREEGEVGEEVNVRSGRCRIGKVGEGEEGEE
jgi:hypothetical protein